MSIDPAAVPSGLTVAAVARRMGVAPATLRTWDRRYGLGPSEHRVGSHRRYSTIDLARLEHMRRLVIAGIPPAEAAQAAREATPSTLTPEEAVASIATPPVPAAVTRRPGGGNVVALPGGGSAVRGLARAARSLDTQGAAEILGTSLRERGVEWTWNELLVPVLIGIGNHWKASGSGIEVEHALSAVAQDCLAASIRSQPPALNTRAVLLACAPDEMHMLPLWAVAAALAEQRISARVLGASLPASALADAVRRLGPAVVFVWAQIPGTADVALIADLPVCRPAARFLIGGAGWSGDLPRTVSRVHDLPDTVAQIAHALGE